MPEEVAKKLPKYPAVSATLFGPLAVGKNFRGKGLGEKLLMDALYRSLKLSEHVSSAGVVVDAKDESGRAFYQKYRFIELPTVNRRLFLQIGAIEKLFAGT